MTSSPHRKAKALEVMHRERRTKDIRQPSAPELTQGPEVAASLPRRIGDSASVLLKEPFELPSPGAVTGVLASIDSSNTKAGPSSGSKGTEVSSSALHSSSQYAGYTPDRGEAFRSDGRGGIFGRTHGQIAFDEFLAGPNEFENELNAVQDQSGSNGDKHEGLGVGAVEDDLRQIWEREIWKRKDQSQDLKDENSDGAAVVALLSDPAFTVDEQPSSNLDSETDGAGGQSYGRLQTRKGMATFVDVLHPRSPLGLMPDFGAPWTLNHTLLATQNDIDERRHCLESGLLAVQPWIDILDRYHDEVWGEMLPLVQEACKESTIANGKQRGLRDTPALRRLRMILKQLDKPENV